MARMIRNVKWHQNCRYDCCVFRQDKATTKREELKLAFKEAAEEMEEDDG